MTPVDRPRPTGRDVGPIPPRLDFSSPIAPYRETAATMPSSEGLVKVAGGRTREAGALPSLGGIGPPILFEERGRR
jgi:hypothetical protein